MNEVKRIEVTKVRYVMESTRPHEPPVSAVVNREDAEHPIALIWYDAKYEPQSIGMNTKFAHAVMCVISSALPEAKLIEEQGNDDG